MADSFTDFVQNLFPSMGQVQQPMLTGTFTDPAGFRASPEAAAYYADPFRQQNTIQQASLDAALKKKQADQAVQKVQGMLSMGVGMDNDGYTGLTPNQIAYLENETAAERGARMQSIDNMLGQVTRGLFGIPIVENLKDTGKVVNQFFANLFDRSQKPAPVVDMSSPSTAPNPFSDTAQLGGGYGYGFDPEVGAPSSPGGGGGGVVGGSLSDMAGNTGSADAPW
jgi:hypothetical protein